MISSHKLKPGLYRLKQDVDNPRGDKRCRWDFWKRPQWKAGTVFVVDDKNRLDIEAPVIKPAGKYDFLFFSAKNDDILDVLIPHLEVEKKSLSSILLAAKEHMHRINPEDILEQLVLDKLISLDCIEWAIGQARKRESERSEHGEKTPPAVVENPT